LINKDTEKNYCNVRGIVKNILVRTAFVNDTYPCTTNWTHIVTNKAHKFTISSANRIWI